MNDCVRLLIPMEANNINGKPMKHNRPKSQRPGRAPSSQAAQVSEVSGTQPFYTLPLLVGKQTHATHAHISSKNGQLSEQRADGQSQNLSDHERVYRQPTAKTKQGRLRTEREVYWLQCFDSQFTHAWTHAQTLSLSLSPSLSVYHPGLSEYRGELSTFILLEGRWCVGDITLRASWEGEMRALG